MSLAALRQRAAADDAAIDERLRALMTRPQRKHARVLAPRVVPVALFDRPPIAKPECVSILRGVELLGARAR